MNAKLTAFRNTKDIPAFNYVIPAQAGISNQTRHPEYRIESGTGFVSGSRKIPAFAGMTTKNAVMTTRNTQAW